MGVDVLTKCIHLENEDKNQKKDFIYKKSLPNI